MGCSAWNVVSDISTVFELSFHTDEEIPVFAILFQHKLCIIDDSITFLKNFILNVFTDNLQCRTLYLIERNSVFKLRKKHCCTICNCSTSLVILIIYAGKSSYFFVAPLSLSEYHCFYS